MGGLAGIDAAPAEVIATLQARTDPVAYIETQGDSLWPGQAEIVRLLWANRELYVPSCHGPGKTFAAARAIVTWAQAWFPDVLVVVLAPTEDQLVAGMWRELAQVFNTWEGLHGRLGRSQWVEDGHGVIAIGRSPREERPGTLQGLHSRNALVVIEEAAEVADQLWQAASSLLTGENTRLLAIGNPTNPAGEFRRRVEGRVLPGVAVHRLSAFATPNLEGIDPDAADLREQLVKRAAQPSAHPSLVDARYVLRVLDEGLEREWRSRILGEFPEQGDDVLIPRAWVERARQPNPDRHKRIYSDVIEAGVDIARMGSDRSVLIPRAGGVVYEPVIWSQVDLMASAGKIAAWCREHSPGRVYIDEGMGIGVVDRLVEQGFPVEEFRHTTAPRDSITFADRRTEYWWQLRLTFERDDIDLSQISEEAFRSLAEELTAVRYSYASSGKRQIEKKDQTKARLRRSPDLADALVYAGWVPAVEWFTSVV